MHQPGVVELDCRLVGVIVRLVHEEGAATKRFRLSLVA